MSTSTTNSNCNSSFIRSPEGQKFTDSLVGRSDIKNQKWDLAAGTVTIEYKKGGSKTITLQPGCSE